jgi:lysophospholipase L1-like esterase
MMALSPGGGFTMRTSRLRFFVPFYLLLCVVPVSSQSGFRLKRGDRIVALGDSITQAGGYLRFMKRVLDRTYPDLQIGIINAGISGHKSTDMSARLKKDVIDREPSVVTISCGINDVWHGFYPTPRGVDLETYTRLMSGMVDQLRAETQAEIYLLTPTIIKEDLLSPENVKLEEYCEAVRRIASEKNCRLVDLNDEFNLALRAAQTGGAPDFHPTSDGVHMKPAGDFLMGAAILRAMGVPITAILKETLAVPPQIPASDAHLQYWGRWDLRNAADAGAVTVNTGSTVIFAFKGTGATLHFSTSHYPQQLPSVWLQVDDQEWRVVSPAADLPVSRQALAEGDHVARLVVKGFREWDRRWDPPLESSIVFRGLSLDQGASLLEPPQRPARVIEYVGDSITEGVLVLFSGPQTARERERWPQYSDGRRTWAYQSALALGAEPRIAGFGRLGLTINGNGGVPPGSYSFPFIYSGVPIDKSRLPDAVVVNMGTNDRRASAQVFEPLYREYIETIRREYPGSAIFCMQPFAGSHGEEIEKVVAALRQAGDQRIHFVSTAGWIDPKTHTTDTLHLNLEGNRIAAEKLVPILKRELGIE